MQLSIERSDDFKTGRWFEVPGYTNVPKAERPQVLVARANNEKFLQVFDRLRKPHAKALKRDTLPTSKVNQLTLEAVATGIFLDFKNIMDGKGNPIENTLDNRIAMLDLNPDFKDIVADLSHEFDAEVIADEAAVAGKSSTTSTGGAGTAPTNTESSAS